MMDKTNLFSGTAKYTVGRWVTEQGARKLVPEENQEWLTYTFENVAAKSMAQLCVILSEQIKGNLQLKYDPAVKEDKLNILSAIEVAEYSERFENMY